MNVFKMDRYSLNARVFPVMICLGPILLLLLGYYYSSSLYWYTLPTIGLFAGFGYLISQIGRDLGKDKEAKLFESWGGKPTTILLRHSSSYIDKNTKGRYHSRLQLMLQTKLPTAEEEVRDQSSADAIYESGVKLLLAKTRDSVRFSLLLTENIGYGFRRNLFGLKPYGIIITSCCLTIELVYYVKQGFSVLNLPFLNQLFLDALVVYMCFWVFYVRSSWVKKAAFSYAERLLESLDTLKT